MNFLKRYRWLFNAPAALLLVAVPAAAAPTPPDFEEDWYVVTMQGGKAGYMHSVMQRVGDEVHTRSKTHFELRRGDASVKMTIEQSFRETVDGRPLGFRHVQSLGSIPETVTGRIVSKPGGGGLTVELVTEQMGKEHAESYPFDADVRFAWGQTLEQMKRGLTPGASFTIKAYEPSLRKDGPVALEFEVHDSEQIDVRGRSRSLHRVTSTFKFDAANAPGAPAGLELASTLWVDNDMRPVVMSLNLGFLQMKMYETTKDEALAEGAPPEMFLDTMVHADRKVDRQQERLKLRIRMKRGVAGALPQLPSTPMQSVEPVSDREAVVTIRRLDWDVIRAARDGEPTDELKPFLAASVSADAKDARVRRLARRAVRGKKTPAEKADALRKFVTDYIEDKGLNVGYATASEVAKTKQGDCTEHSVLLAAMARAAGLPARGVGGLVAVPDGFLGASDRTAFGYHMWTQVFIGGQWVDIDAAMRQTECDPTHVAVSLMPLADEGFMSTIVSLASLIGQIEIEVVE